ncbi:MAG: glutamate racemase [Eubacteriales bacterium]|jgi:glutamate racemase|nr:glutamate racemase [Eubacteriales bacterium]
MDTRPIGIFDSGMGGLTCVRQMIRLLPGEDIVYFGDTGRVPYGGRSAETIVRYARQDVAFLRSFDLKTIVIACGTVSTTALDVLERENDLPILGVVQPAAKAAVNTTKSGKIGVIGTKATIRSGAYEASIRALLPEAQLIAKACPLLVPLVEDGRVHRGDAVTERVVEEYLAPVKTAGVDTLVLGCTHYPLLMDVISDYMGTGVTLIDTGEEAARAAAALLFEQSQLNDPSRKGRRRYYASDSAADFAATAALFLGKDISDRVERVAIENY